MLTLLQYLSLLSAVMLPFLIGGIVKCIKSGEQNKIMVLSGVLLLCVTITGLALFIAFSAQP